MPVLVEKSPVPMLRTDGSVRPVILREGISWSGGSGKRALRLELTFDNPGIEPSAPTTARVEVAPFGAFLSWSPLTRVVVPGLPPGGRRLVTATAAGDAPLPRTPQRLSRAPGGFGRLTRMLLDSDRSVHFVGNLNVYVTDSAPVERHMQRAVGLKAGSRNIALFCVGDRRPDNYTFDIGHQEPGWEMELGGVDWGTTVRFATNMIGLVVTPPRGADSGRASVIVERQSTGQRVPVEFELEAAPTARCFYF